MRRTICSFLIAMSLLAVQPSWASEDYGSAGNATSATTSTPCPAQSGTETPDDPPAPQNVVEYGAGG